MSSDIIKKSFKEWWLKKYKFDVSFNLEYRDSKATELFDAFQAACNMFLQHIEILPDDAEPQDKDIVELLGEFDSLYGEYEASRRKLYGIISGEHYFHKILTRNGKFCIKESELMEKKV